MKIGQSTIINTVQPVQLEGKKQSLQSGLVGYFMF